MDHLLTQIVRLMVRHHPSDLSFSRISQLTKVPRPTLYYYFGKSLESMLEQSLTFGMKGVMLLSQFDDGATHENWEVFQQRRLEDVLRIIKSYPWAPALYFRYRNDDSFLGKSIRAMEGQYFSKLERAWLRYHGREPSKLAVRLSSYLKLGLLYGVAAEPDLWFSQEGEPIEALVSKMNSVVNSILNEKF